MFTTVTLYLSTGQTTVRAMIDCGAAFNFISQMKVKEWDLQGTVDVPPGLKTLDGTPLKCYEAHVLRTGVTDATGHEIRTKQAIIAADMTGVDMILGLPWLAIYLRTEGHPG